MNFIILHEAMFHTRIISLWLNSIQNARDSSNIGNGTPQGLRIPCNVIFLYDQYKIDNIVFDIWWIYIVGVSWHVHFNPCSPGQNGLQFADDIFKRILNEKCRILIKISQKFVPKDSIDNNPALVQIMARRRIGDEPLSEPMLTRFIDAYRRH